MVRWARPKSSRQDLWYDEDDDEDDSYYDTKFVGGSREEIDLRELRREEDEYEEDAGFDQTLDRVSRYAYDDDDDDDDDNNYEDTEATLEDDNDDEDSGNFWYNPKEGFDPVPDPSPKKRRRREESLPTSTAAPHKRESKKENGRRSRTSKTTFRSGTPPPPAAIEDLYNRIFWYGFDPADTTSPTDRTVFGGTKGKFNGLAYLQEGVGGMPSTRRPRRSRPRKGEVEDDGDWENEPDEEDDDYSESEKEQASYPPEPTTPNQYRQSVTPPYDPPRPMPGPPTTVPSRQRPPERRKQNRRESREQDDFDDNTRMDLKGDWVPKQVSSWFQLGEEEDEEEEEDYGGLRKRKSGKQRSGSSSSPFKVLDVFFGLNRDRLGEKAEMYDRQMGLRPAEDWSRASRKKSRREERRKGYAYPYVDEDEEPPVAEVILEENDPELAEQYTAKNIENKVEDEEQRSKGRRELSWEERALAVERVPPAGIQAWGPKGDLRMDARTHAISDAIDDINGMKQTVKEKQQLVEEARENVAILKVDAELDKKRLSRNRQDPRVVQDKLRRIDRKVDDAARSLRYTQNVAKMAQEDLVDLESRHWAVLSCYSPGLAEETIAEALRELEENEPAARRYREKTTGIRDAATAQDDPVSSSSDAAPAPESNSETS
jgi:hypothetical protein